MKTKLSVNVNKIALLRNSRGNDYPNLVAMAKRAIAAGAHGITVHPRPDERHITYADVPALAELLSAYPHLEYNIEGYPSDDFVELVLAANPDQVTLVPDEPGQLTSDHGWQLGKNAELAQGGADVSGGQESVETRLEKVLKTFREAGVRSSLFMDPVAEQMAAAKAVGADRIELYTEDFARAYGTELEQAVTAQYQAAAQAAVDAGLGVNAGHDLNLDNLKALLEGGLIEEVSIGHAIMVESFDFGYEGTIKQYIEIIESVA